MLICPGCGGRNDPAARTCQWCARPFVVEHRRVPVAWIVGAAFAIFTVLTIVILMLALISALRSRIEPVAVETPGFTAIEVEPDPTESPVLEPTATLESTPTITPEPQPEFLQIGNTGATGAFIRREPRANAPGIVALRDGLPVRVVGPDQTIENRVWKNVEDRNGNRGWTPQEYLVPTQQRF